MSKPSLWRMTTVKKKSRAIYTLVHIFSLLGLTGSLFVSNQTKQTIRPASSQFLCSMDGLIDPLRIFQFKLAMVWTYNLVVHSIFQQIHVVFFAVQFRCNISQTTTTTEILVKAPGQRRQQTVRISQKRTTMQLKISLEDPKSKDLSQ